MTSPIYSKTLWANALAVGGAILTSHFGYHITESETVAGMAIINSILRKFTKEPLEW